MVLLCARLLPDSGSDYCPIFWSFLGSILSKMEPLEWLLKLSCIKRSLLLVYLIFILILVVSIVSSVLLHGINPVLFLLTIFDLNSVIQLSRQSLNNHHNKETNNTEISYIIINRPSSEFIFVALICYITAIFNQVIAIVAVIRRHLCVLAFTLITNVLIFCVSVNFIKTNLFILLLIVILLTIFYTIMLKQIKTTVHYQNHQSETRNHQQHLRMNNNFTANPVETTVQMYPASGGGHIPSTPTDPKILAPIIYCPHYSESVC